MPFTKQGKPLLEMFPVSVCLMNETERRLDRVEAIFSLFHLFASMQKDKADIHTGVTHTRKDEAYYRIHKKVQHKNTEVYSHTCKKN